jgi:uncharacterized glyoxalase superfamily protein PhnB
MTETTQTTDTTRTTGAAPSTDSPAGPPPGAWPALRYRDAEAALTFLVGVLGFRELVRHAGGPDRPVSHAELGWPDGGGIMLGSATAEPWSGSAGAPGTATTYLSVADEGALRAVAARVTEAGWAVLRPLADTDYGATEFACSDPEGNAWSVGTYRGARWS